MLKPVTSPESIRYFRSWKEWRWHVNRNERIRGVGKATFDMQVHTLSPYNMKIWPDDPWNREEIKERKRRHTALWGDKMTPWFCRGKSHRYLKCLYMCMYVCYCKYAQKTFNQRQFQKVPISEASSDCRGL